MKKESLLFLFTLFSIGLYSQSYIGTITKQVNFREGPSIDNIIISALKPNNQVFIISIDTENDYFNIIDIATDREGYVHKSFVKIGKMINKSDQSVFTPNGKSSDYDSEVKIFNNTSKTLTLKMNAEVYRFKPYETKNMKFTPGEYDFRASAPGVIPNIGTERLNNSQAYSWEFYITTSWR